MKSIVIATSILISSLAHAWEPTKPIEAIIGFGPGSGNEISFRIVSSQVEANTGAKFVINLKPGAGSAVANEYVSKDVADGYHICVCSDSALSATDRMVLPNKKHTTDDFAYAMSFASTPMTFVVKADDPINTIQDLVTALRTEKPSVGESGSAARLTYELLLDHVKFTEDSQNVVRVTHKSPADTLNDIMGGHVRIGIMPLLISYPSHAAGKVKIIAVTSERAVPTLNAKPMSSVYPDFVFNLDWGIVLPKGTNKEVVDWYVAEFNTAINNKDIQTKLADNMMFINKRLLNSRDFQNSIVQEEKKYTHLVDRVISQQSK